MPLRFQKLMMLSCWLRLLICRWNIRPRDSILILYMIFFLAIISVWGKMVTHIGLSNLWSYASNQRCIIYCIWMQKKILFLTRHLKKFHFPVFSTEIGTEDRTIPLYMSIKSQYEVHVPVSRLEFHDSVQHNQSPMCPRFVGQPTDQLFVDNNSRHVTSVSEIRALHKLELLQLGLGLVYWIFCSFSTNTIHSGSSHILALSPFKARNGSLVKDCFPQAFHYLPSSGGS